MPMFNKKQPTPKGPTPAQRIAAYNNAAEIGRLTNRPMPIRRSSGQIDSARALAERTGSDVLMTERNLNTDWR
jgi:hypothetical protein